MNLDLHVTITDPPEGFEEYAHAMIHDALPGVLQRRYPFLEGPAFPTITVTTIKDVDAAEKAAPPHHEWIDALTTLDRLANSHPIQQWPDIQAQVRQALDMLSAEFGTLLVGLALGGDL